MACVCCVCYLTYNDYAHTIIPLQLKRARHKEEVFYEKTETLENIHLM